MNRVLISALLILIFSESARAGLYYSGEKFASLPAQWRGFLLDHRTLRNIAVNPKDEVDASPLRLRYLQEAAKLHAKADKTADELADLGALYVRLGEQEKAIEILRRGQRDHPNHFAITANLGTAWQMFGQLRLAAEAIEQAVLLAPGKYLAYEEAHFKLLRQRLRSPAGGFDDLFGVRFVSKLDDYEPGKMDPDQRKKLPVRSVAIAQQLALWLPADGPLLWQLAELANAHGDVRNAAAMMEGCTSTFGMKNPKLKQHRLILREAVEDMPKAKIGMKEEHGEKHRSTIEFRSLRPLISRLDTDVLPAIDAKGVNPIPWDLLGETVLEKPFKANFSKYLQALEGKKISLNGFMYPLGEDPDVQSFLFIEAPVGCWYCEVPETTGILLVQLPAGETAKLQRGLVRVVGQLSLNATDAEDFLYTVKDARVGPLD